MNILIRNKKIGNGEPSYIIAEMAWSHDGELQKAKNIVKGAIDAKADAICFHLTSVEDYMVPDYQVLESGASAAVGKKPLYEFLKEKNLNPNEWKILFEQAKAEDLHILVMPNDEPSFDLAQKLDADGYVIAPAVMAEAEFLKKIAKSKKPLFLRIGGATLQEIEKIINLAKKTGNTNISIIHGFQSFPTPLEEMNISLLDYLKKRLEVPVGFTDHTNGESEIALMIPMVAIGAGADLIEKHITHDRSLKGIDFESALDPENFSKMVENIRNAEKALGSPQWRDLSKKEMKYREVARKHLVANRDMKKEERISREDIAFKRANGGLYSEQIDSIIGRKIKKDLVKNDEIYEDMVE